MGTDVLPAVLKAIGHEIENDYVAGFYLSSATRPKPRRIEVVLHSQVRGKLIEFVLRPILENKLILQAWSRAHDSCLLQEP